MIHKIGPFLRIFISAHILAHTRGKINTKSNSRFTEKSAEKIINVGNYVFVKGALTKRWKRAIMERYKSY